MSSLVLSVFHLVTSFCSCALVPEKGMYSFGRDRLGIGMELKREGTGYKFDSRIEQLKPCLGLRLVKSYESNGESTSFGGGTDVTYRLKKETTLRTGEYQVRDLSSVLLPKNLFFYIYSVWVREEFERITYKSLRIHERYWIFLDEINW